MRRGGEQEGGLGFGSQAQDSRELGAACSAFGFRRKIVISC